MRRFIAFIVCIGMMLTTGYSQATDQSKNSTIETECFDIASAEIVTTISTIDLQGQTYLITTKTSPKGEFISISDKPIKSKSNLLSIFYTKPETKPIRIEYSMSESSNLNLKNSITNHPSSTIRETGGILSLFYTKI